eukprot:Opistho-2@28196
MAAMAIKHQDTYTFASEPRAVQPQRRKYRETAGPGQQTGVYGNIMYDRRIVRGNTYASAVLPAAAQPDPVELQRQQEARRRAVARRRAAEQLRPRTPEAVDGRKHMDVQTELYLEEISDRTPEADADTQTDAFIDRPPSPLFVPAKTGVDVATQIEDGDLFDFDVEVRPILEVLVGKTIEQALMEVMEEEELANLRHHQREFEQIRNSELAETQRLEEQERRRKEEKDRRLQQQRAVLQKETETSDKVAARAFAQSYLADLVPSVFENLQDNGYFYDSVEREVELQFMPWLSDHTERNLSRTLVARAMLDTLLRNAVTRHAATYSRFDIIESDPEPVEEQVEPSHEHTADAEGHAPTEDAEAIPVPTMGDVSLDGGAEDITIGGDEPADDGAAFHGDDADDA